MENCNHKWVYQETIKSKEEDYHCRTYKKVDIYFCEKCLQITEKVKSESVGRYGSTPDWY